MFRTVPLSIIRSFALYTQQTYMTYTIAVCAVKISYGGHRNCPKHVEFYSKNKFEKLVHLVCFIIRIYHNTRSPEHQIQFYNFFYRYTNIYFYIRNTLCKTEILSHLLCKQFPLYYMYSLFIFTLKYPKQVAVLGKIYIVYLTVSIVRNLYSRCLGHDSKGEPPSHK